MQLRESSKLITWIYFSHYMIFVFSISQSLPPRFAFFACLLFSCSSLLCVDLEAFSLDVKSLFDLSLLDVLQSRKQPMSFLLWSLIVLHRTKQHELNVVGVRNLPNFRCTSNHYIHCFYSHWWWYRMQAITTCIVQGWIREINGKLWGAVMRILYMTYRSLWNNIVIRFMKERFREVVSMSTKSWKRSLYVTNLVHNSNKYVAELVCKIMNWV